MNFRIGFGYDVHQFEQNRPFILGGIKIPFHLGLKGHSDADALIHSICDALLGAANLGDIGTHFPDNDVAFKNIDSKILLKGVQEKIKAAEYSISNIDCTINLEKPKMKPHIPAMRKCMAEILEIDEGQLSIKATTNEKMGFVGREEGIAVYSIALIFR